MDWSNRLSIAGATMRDAGHASKGEHSNYLSDYMKDMRAKQEKELKSKIEADMFKAYEDEGLAGAVDYASKNPNEYSLSGVQEFAKFDKIKASLESGSTTTGNSLFDMYDGATDESINDFLGTKRSGGLLGLGFGPGSKKEIDGSPETIQALKNTKSVEDLDELLKNRDAYQEAGVDVDRVFQYYRK
jgi:hypothetical protein